MCERCTYFGVELKCVKCRIKRLPSEYPELLANAVKRSEMIRCRRCGYLGRRYDAFKPLRWTQLVAVPFGLLVGVIPALFILLAVASRGCPCPACETTLEVIPAPAATVPSPEAELAWTLAHEQSQRVYRANALKGLGAVLVGVALMLRFVWRTSN